jgi:adenosine deaminase
MYNILHQHYESVLRLAKIVTPEALDNFYNIFSDDKFLKLKPQDRLRFLQKSLPIPNEKYFTLENFCKVAEQTVREMEKQNIDHIDLRVSLHLERWKDVNGISHARQIYDNALVGHKGKTISFIAAIDLTRSKEEIKKSIASLFEESNINSIAGIDITLYESDIKKFNRYYESILRVRSDYKKKIIIHLGEFTTGDINLEILKKLKPDRIAHGIALLESNLAINFLKEHKICLDICPVSNSILGVVDWSKNNPVKKAIDLGVLATINTDDPIMFNTNIKKEIEISNLCQKDLELLIDNSKKFAGKLQS